MQQQALDPYYVKPKEDGVYWIYDHKLGTIYALLHANGYWHDDGFETAQHREIIEGPLPYPTQEQIESQAEHFEAVRMKEWGELGYDPVWPMEPLPLWDPKLHPEVVPHPVIAGYYWIQFDDQEYPTFVSAREGRWLSVGLEPVPWIHEDLEWPPLVLFGPVPKPSKDRVKLLRPGDLKN